MVDHVGLLFGTDRKGPETAFLAITMICKKLLNSEYQCILPINHKGMHIGDCGDDRHIFCSEDGTCVFTVKDKRFTHKDNADLKKYKNSASTPDPFTYSIKQPNWPLFEIGENDDM